MGHSRYLFTMPYSIKYVSPDRLRAGTVFYYESPYDSDSLEVQRSRFEFIKMSDHEVPRSEFSEHKIQEYSNHWAIEYDLEHGTSRAVYFNPKQSTKTYILQRSLLDVELPTNGDWDVL